jgi:hypothetical protein
MVCSIAMIVSVGPAQGATISGTVTDTKGQAVAGAQVTFTEEADPSDTFSSITDADGRYVVGLTEVAVEEEVEGDTFPRYFALLQNYPNPFNPATIIPYRLRESAYVRLMIYSTLGDDAGVGAGAGVYVVRMEAGDLVQSRKMLMVDGASAGGVRAQGRLRRPLARSTGSSEEGGMSYTLTITGEDITSFTRTGIVINDNRVLDFVVPILSSSPENVFNNLDYAMNHKDIGIFEDLLDEGYWFYCPTQLDTLDFAWNKAEDVTLTGRVFEFFSIVDYELMETGAYWIEYGVNIAPEDATDISDEHPNENWEVFRRPVTMCFLDETGTNGYFIDSNFEFKMRAQNDPDTGERIWKIVRWTEYSGSGKIAKTAVSSSCWGAIKRLFS